MNESEKRIVKILNTNVDSSKTTEANQVCIKKPTHVVQIKPSRNNEKQVILSNIRNQVGIL